MAIHSFGKAYGWGPEQVEKFSIIELNFLTRQLMKEQSSG